MHTCNGSEKLKRKPPRTDHHHPPHTHTFGIGRGGNGKENNQFLPLQQQKKQQLGYEENGFLYER